MHVVDHVLAFWQWCNFSRIKALDFRVFIHAHVLKSKYREEYSTVDKVGRENIIAEETLFRVLLRHDVSQNIDAITGTLRLNSFDIADSICCMYSIDRFWKLLRCKVSLYFINTWDINDLTFEYSHCVKSRLHYWAVTRQISNPLNFVALGLRAGGMIHCGPRLELLGFSRLLASSTEFIGSDLEVSPLPPPLVAVDVAYPHYCMYQRQSMVTV